MDSSRKKQLLLLITNSYAATNVIHSGLIKRLADEYDIHLISNLINNKELTEINHHFDIQMQKIQVSLFKENHLTRFLRQLEKAVFFTHFKIETQKIKNYQAPFFSRLITNRILKCISWLDLTEVLLSFLRKIIILITRSDRHVRNWNLPDFDGVISTSPLDIRENTIVNYLKTKNVISLAIVISWDNLTSKGIINADHNFVLVWNQFMADEYDRFYRIFDIRQQKIAITGVPRFDLYYKPLPATHTINTVRQQLHIPDRNKVILFATSAFNHCPDQSDILRHLLEYASENGAVTIVLRCHPADDQLQYTDFAHEPDLRICPPLQLDKLRKSSISLPDLDILLSLASILKTCDVCIQIASTIRLEAAICNRPCISIAYDGNRILSDSHSVKRFYNYSHQLPLNVLKLDQLVSSKIELFHTLDQMLQAPNRLDHTDKIRPFVYHTSPDSASLTMKYIREWLS